MGKARNRRGVDENLDILTGSSPLPSTSRLACLAYSLRNANMLYPCSESRKLFMLLRMLITGFVLPENF
jgi:hypothetical protein